jgi:hypothetical protein
MRQQVGSARPTAVLTRAVARPLGGTIISVHDHLVEEPPGMFEDRLPASQSSTASASNRRDIGGAPGLGTFLGVPTVRWDVGAVEPHAGRAQPP